MANDKNPWAVVKEEDAPKATPTPNPWAVKSESDAPPAETGYSINPVGNKVIVPKEGESFADTMKRAVEAGKHNTPETIEKQKSLIPGDVASVLLAAPAIGFAGAGALAGGGEALGSLGDILAPRAAQIGQFGKDFGGRVAENVKGSLPKIPEGQPAGVTAADYATKLIKSGLGNKYIPGGLGSAWLAYKMFGGNK